MKKASMRNKERNGEWKKGRVSKIKWKEENKRQNIGVKIGKKE